MMMIEPPCYVTTSHAGKEKSLFQLLTKILGTSSNEPTTATELIEKTVGKQKKKKKLLKKHYTYTEFWARKEVVAHHLLFFLSAYHQEWKRQQHTDPTLLLSAIGIKVPNSRLSLLFSHSVTDVRTVGSEFKIPIPAIPSPPKK